jgi:glycine cleavage system H protein
MKIPEDRFYTQSHEWVRLEGELATVGISDYAQDSLGDIVYIELPSAGRVVRPGEEVAAIESVKTASDIYAPLAGEIVEVNPALVDHPELINKDPYGEGWIFKLRLDGPEPQGLLDAASYRSLVDSL